MNIGIWGVKQGWVRLPKNRNSFNSKHATTFYPIQFNMSHLSSLLTHLIEPSHSNQFLKEIFMTGGEPQ